eukprot:2435159-Prymnesium_polylepis.1
MGMSRVVLLGVAALLLVLGVLAHRFFGFHNILASIMISQPCAPPSHPSSPTFTCSPTATGTPLAPNPQSSPFAITKCEPARAHTHAPRTCRAAPRTCRACPHAPRTRRARRLARQILKAAFNADLTKAVALLFFAPLGMLAVGLSVAN